MSEASFPWWEPEALDRNRWAVVVQPLLERFERARDRGLLPHAVIFVGPPGLGRELAAVEAAVMMVCDGSPGLWSDSGCASRVRRGVHPDVMALRSGGRGRIITIDEMRDQVVKDVATRPFEGLRRVWIIDGVERGSFPGPTANAFLKSLEEPPDHAMFILLAANPDAVLPTIRSRCQRLYLPGAGELAKTLVRDGIPPELAVTPIDSDELSAAVEGIRKALDLGFSGETGPLVRLPYRVPDGLSPFAAIASVALEMACAEGDSTRTEDMIRLATDLLASERRARALNLNTRAQVVSCLMRWYRELAEC